MTLWPVVMTISLPVLLYACATPQPTVDESGHLAVGVEQIRDPLTGKLYYVACNPCTGRTPKTVAQQSAPTPMQAIPPVIPPVSAAGANENRAAVEAELQTLAKPSPPPVSPEKIANLKMEQEFTSVKRVVPFSFDRAIVGPNARLAVNELIPLAKQSEKIWVRGRTDSVGSKESNKQVAQARAATIRQEFIVAGIPKSKISTTYCTDCFIASNDSEAGRRANRRVDVELLMPSKVASALPSPVYAVADAGVNLASATNMENWHEKDARN